VTPGAPGVARARDPEDENGLFFAAKEGNRRALARLLSVVEQGGDASREVARSAYRSPPPYSVGLTGAPGAGKSTIVDCLITEARKGWRPADAAATERVDQVAVLAVDPTSPFSGGAILGDRVRMQRHATDPNVFIRSMATRGHLGGLALAVPDAVRVLGAAGLALVLVETVGVGQMEVEVASTCDTTVVTVTPGWGDSMQANKAGLLEVADIFVINKADRPGAREARVDLHQMLELSPPGDWSIPIVDTVAATGEGIDELWTEVANHREHLTRSGKLERRRSARLEQELRRVLFARLVQRVERLSEGETYGKVVKKLSEGRLDPYEAADLLIGDT